MTPGAFPGYSLLSAFGRAAPLNLELQRAGRVLPFPFHFLNNNLAMNVKPKNYSWQTFYDHVIDLTSYSFSGRAIWNRFKATRGTIPKWMNVVRAVSSEGWGRLGYYKHVRSLLETDSGVRKYFAAETDALPPFYEDRVKHDLGPFWSMLPAGALRHDPNAYLNAERERVTRGTDATVELQRSSPT
jgi:hypothetical protein